MSLLYCSLNLRIHKAVAVVDRCRFHARWNLKARYLIGALKSVMVVSESE